MSQLPRALVDQFLLELDRDLDEVGDAELRARIRAHLPRIVNAAIREGIQTARKRPPAATGRRDG
ncbi:MAG: hypothetical protein U0167_19530 [bacterium]